MDKNLIRSYFKKVPAVICTAGSYIASKNPKAREKLRWLTEGGRLFDRMSPESVLKYEAHFAEHRAGSAFCFTINGADRIWYARAVFDSICSRRFAEILLFESRDEMEREVESVFSLPDTSEEIEFASVLLSVPEESFEPYDSRGLIDLKACTRELTSRLCGMGISALYSENEEAGNAIYVPEEISMTSYQQIITAMAMAFVSIGGHSDIRIKVCKFGESVQVFVSTVCPPDLMKAQSTEEICTVFPAARSFVSICDYIAGLCGCTLEFINDSDRGDISLCLMICDRPDFDVDFKSRDPLLYFDECFEFTRKYILSLSGDAQKQS